MDNEKMISAIISIKATYDIAKKAMEEIEENEKDTTSKWARESVIAQFLFKTLKQDLEMVGL